MAHLEVEKKPTRPWWIWVLIVLILIALAALLFKRCNESPQLATTAIDSNATVLATTVPDWNSVDFNSATSTDADLSDTSILTRNTYQYTIYTLGENILFPSDGNNVSAKGVEKLTLINAVLAKRFAGATIGIYGSTDSTGPADENKSLGQQRATAVKDWFINSGHIPSENISVQSLGETAPVASNATTAGRQQNRNVAIVVFPKK